MALEATAITLYRIQAGKSPAANFGRMPAGYRISTGNNAHLVARGQRARSGRDPGAPVAVGSACVAGKLDADPCAADWMSWAWTPWLPIARARRKAAGAGLYRIRSGSTAGLAYIGQGNITSRLRSHQAKGRRPSDRQSIQFSGDLGASWVSLPEQAIVNLLEHENDLISAHVLATGLAPSAQFLG
jgi:hypothetical protein